MLLDNRLDGVSLSTLNTFCVSAELESFVGAAERLGLTPATVSRSIARLEERLSVQLFSRTTRQVKLTELGKDYYQACSMAIKGINDAENDIINGSSTPRGKLKISVPTTYGYYRLMPILVAFQQKYLDIRLEIDISNTNIDFIAEGFDISVRLGEIQDSRLVVKKLEDAMLGVFASGDYLQKFGTPKSLHDLETHQCIQFIMPNSGRPLPWIFNQNRDSKAYEFTPKQPIFISGDVVGAVRYANAGGGIFQCYDFIAKHSENTHLEEILYEFKGNSRPFNLVYPYTKYLPNKIRIFIDFVVEQINMT